MSELPKKYTKLIGTEVEIKGCIFSYKKEYEEPQKFKVLNVRRGTALMFNTKTNEMEGYTIQLLLKNDTMKKAQWTKPMPDTVTPYVEDDE